MAWKTYNQYYADNPAAMEQAGAGRGSTETNLGAKTNWGGVENPYRFRNEYNQYLSGLPEAEQMMARSGVRGAAFLNKAGALGDSARAEQGIPAASGSSFSIDPAGLSKMWK